MKSQVIGICGDAVPRAVQKDALTLADTRPAANTSPSRSAAHGPTHRGKFGRLPHDGQRRLDTTNLWDDLQRAQATHDKLLSFYQQPHMQPLYTVMHTWCYNVELALLVNIRTISISA